VDALVDLPVGAFSEDGYLRVVAQAARAQHDHGLPAWGLAFSLVDYTEGVRVSDLKLLGVVLDRLRATSDVARTARLHDLRLSLLLEQGVVLGSVHGLPLLLSDEAALVLRIFSHFWLGLVSVGRLRWLQVVHHLTGVS
jgi:hypothetical protein